MEFKFNVTGTQRKELVTAIAEVLNISPKYLGAPTFAYEVGACKIDKTGTLTGEVTKEVRDTLLEKGFTFETLEKSEPTTDLLVIELPLEGFSETALDNLEILVASKATLIKKSVGTSELSIIRTESRLQFPWFANGLEAEKVDAYTRFVAALCNMAKEQKRITAKEKEVENEKYAFRCFLLRLGFIGAEYAAARKILLAGLSGNSSFKSGERRQQGMNAPVAHTGETETAAEEMGEVAV